MVAAIPAGLAQGLGQIHRQLGGGIPWGPSRRQGIEQVKLLGLGGTRLWWGYGLPPADQLEKIRLGLLNQGLAAPIAA
jgi:hypothetical protein